MRLRALFKKMIPVQLQDIFYYVREARYRQVWNRFHKENTIKAIIGRDLTEEEFDAFGEKDAIWIREIIGDQKEVIDVGCGIGRLEKYLSRFCARVNAVDVSPEVLKLAKARLKDVKNVTFTLVNDDCLLSNYEDSRFDAVISFLVLQHLDKEDAFRYLTEFNRVLRPHGFCLLQFPNFHSELYFDTFLENVKSHTTRRKKARMRLYIVEEIQYLLDKAGFSCEISKDAEGKEFRVIARKVKDTYRISNSV